MAETKQAPAPAAHATEVGHEQPAHEKGFPPFDSSTFASQLLWLAIAFVAFYSLMSKVALPRITAILETRKDKIARDLAEASRLKSETDAAEAAYEKALAAARQKANGIASETRLALNAEVDAKRHAAEASLAEKLKAAEVQIGAIKDKALAEVGGIARETAEAVLGTLTSLPVSSDEIAQAVDTALAH
jgi:F-type H+-transporting ATPase subunit b